MNGATVDHHFVDPYCLGMQGPSIVIENQEVKPKAKSSPDSMEHYVLWWQIACIAILSLPSNGDI